MYSCPMPLNCSEGIVSIENGIYPSYVAIVSGTFSCIGSLLIWVTSFSLQNIRSGAQKIITSLAMADFICAVTYIIGSANFITHFNKTDPTQCKIFTDICVAQSTITLWFVLSSFIWTVILAFYFYLIIVYGRLQLAGRLMPLYHIVAWGAPGVVIIPLVATGQLGYSPYVASNWCFIKDNNYEFHGLKVDKTETISIVFGGELWEVMTYFVITALYLHIWTHVTKVTHLMHTNNKGIATISIINL